MGIDEARAALVSRATLDERGWSSRSIDRALEDGRLRRVHHGWYIEPATWEAAFTESRHLMQVIAVHEQQRGTDGVAALASAAVLNGLPLFRLTPERVHLSGGTLDGHTRRSASVARHEMTVPKGDRTTVGGIPCTSLARTVADMIRFSPIETGLALADAAFRRAAWDDARRAYDAVAAERFRDDVRRRMLRVRRGRGLRRGRRVLELADGRAQLPGESVSRLYLLELGYAAPRLQVPVPAPAGNYYVDFGLDDVDVWGEYDGEGKYLDPELRGDATITAAILAEKRREDWIRGTTGRRFVRWGKAEVRTAQTLGAHLAAHHLRPPR